MSEPEDIERAQLRALIEEGIASGVDPRPANEIFDEILAELLEEDQD